VAPGAGSDGAFPLHLERADFDGVALALARDSRAQVIACLGTFERGQRLLVALSVEFQKRAVGCQYAEAALGALQSAIASMRIGVALHFSRAIRVYKGNVLPCLRRA
jgi:hypothetical protein